jgi:hypothetical protein
VLITGWQAWRVKKNTEEYQLRSIAHHEAGHAVIAFVLGQWIMKVTIVPGYSDETLAGDYLGLAKVTDGHSYEQALVFMAGYAAQKQFGNPEYDKRTTADYILLDKALKSFKGNGFESVNQYSERLVELMVNQHWELITAFAEHLLVVKEMESDDAREFLVATHQRLIREAHYPPEPVFDGLDAYEAWIEKHKEKLKDLKDHKEKVGD